MYIFLCRRTRVDIRNSVPFSGKKDSQLCKMILAHIFILSLHVGIYGGSRHSNIVSELVYQCIHTTKWPVCVYNCEDVMLPARCSGSGAVFDPSLFSHTFSPDALIVFDSEEIACPRAKQVEAFIATKKPNAINREITSHFFPVNLTAIPSKGVRTKNIEHFARSVLYSLLIS